MKTIQNAYPYPFYYWQVVSYTLSGLLTSLYLAYTHYKNHTDLFYSSFCAVSQAINCDTVAQSPWSVFLGLPVAIWGVFAYSLFLVLLIPLKKSVGATISGWCLLTALATLASCYSVYLAVLSATRIHSWCLLCMLTYAINFLLAFSSWLTFRRFSTTHFFSVLPTAFPALIRTTFVKWGLFLLLVLTIAGRFSIPAYWIQEMAPINASVATGMTKEGHPWIGAENPHFVIEEFTDYQCFQCSKVHFYLRQLINQQPTRIRLVHRHYPLDNEFNKIIAPTPFHVGSGRLALIAVIAADHGVFWAVNDALYRAVQSKKESIEIEPFAKLMRISTEQLATEMVTKKTLKYLQHDIVQGLQHGITGTPSFVIDGKMYPNALPPELLKEMLQ